MNNYTLLILRRAQKELARVPVNDYERVRDAMGALATVPRPTGCRKLVGREGWRIRIGDYRVIYEIDDKQKTVTGNRRDVYE
ncbi:MAG TPA: type II toxin-antitoxin system RelE/ParE family toxin [Pyrinomonadaceae bacterium]|jgi:mRNA interferase RelE/StbE